MADQQKKIVKYFGWATNSDPEMMYHMVGRKGIKSVPATLLGYEACIQKSRDMRSEIPENSISKQPPKKIIISGWGEDFNMYVTRPNPNAKIKGVIWDITEVELELVKEWECTEYGLQDEVQGIAVDEQGSRVQVDVQTLTKPTDKVYKVLGEDNFDLYIAPKEEMWKMADGIRVRYLERKNKTND